MAINFNTVGTTNYDSRVGAYYKPGNISKNDYGESTLSVKAQELLQRIREKYGDYDIFVGDSEEALNTLSRGSEKSVSVMFSADELEKMAEDEEYANGRLAEMEKAAEDALKFMEDYNNSDESKEKGTMIKSVAVTVNPDGTTSVFAELAKVNEAQRERIEKAREEKADKAKEEKKAEQEKPVNPEKPEKPEPIKTVRVYAESLDELKELIDRFDWRPYDRLAAEAVKGTHIDFSV